MNTTKGRGGILLCVKYSYQSLSDRFKFNPGFFEIWKFDSMKP